MNEKTQQAAKVFPQFQAEDMFFPVRASSVAQQTDDLFYFITWVSVIFFVLIVSLMAFFVIRYRRRAGVEPLPSPHHNQLLEISWSVLPAFIIVIMFYRGLLGYMDLRTPPGETYDMNVNAKRWVWNFSYPKNNYIDDELHVALDRPTKMTMMSDDVIHSFYIPAFRVKMDVVPGRYSTVWFTPTRVGEYTLECAEYCGRSHSDMLAKVVVHSSVDDYNKWLDVASDPFKTGKPLPEIGRMFYEKRGCIQCHSTDGSAKVGPSFKGIWGIEEPMADGTKVLVDENYIRTSILEPGAQIRQGYKNQMPVFKGLLDDRQIGSIIEFIKTLK